MAPSGSDLSPTPPPSTGLASRSADAFLLEEYKHLSALLRQNEDAGDRRITILLTLTTAVGSGLALLATKGPCIATENLSEIAIVALAALLTLGVVTLRRVHKRNMTTDSYKESMDKIRSIFAASDDRLVRYNPFPRPMSFWKDHRILKGGLLTITCLLNSVFVAALSWMYTPANFPSSKLLAGTAFVLSFIAQWIITADEKLNP